MNDFCYNFTV